MVLYINLREALDVEQYPTRDKIPAELLDDRGCTEILYSDRCARFFTAVFRAIARYLADVAAEIAASNAGVQADVSAKAHYARWERDLCDVRQPAMKSTASPRDR